MPDFLPIVTSNLGVAFLLFLSLISTAHPRCGQGVSCRGERPKLANECCPVEPYNVCRPADGDDCDTELGYSCVNDLGMAVADGQGTCRGQYNLTVQNVSLNSVNLTWKHIAESMDMFEYVLLYRERNYHYADSGWKTKDVGESPKTVLKSLTPGTLYFIRICIWSRRGQGNCSEAIMAETQPVTFCEYMSNHYSVGEQFVHECEDNCTCLPTGQFQCHPVCPEALGLPEAPEEGCEYVREDDCCTYIKRCTVGAESCNYNNQTYSHGHEFFDSCQDCQCNYGKVECQYSQECPGMEPTASCPSPKVGGLDENCCPEWYCESTCTYENRTFHHLEYFTSAECGLCQCSVSDGVQCASDCPPVVMVLADAACPDPQIKKDGCCETLHCHDPSSDILQFMRNMFALSYSPATLTLSFEVDSQPDVNGAPTYCQYEILYTNTSDPNGNWSRRQVHPTDVLLQQDQSGHMEPTDALSRDSAIVVGNRAYVTLSGMHPNTTYYVKIIPLDGLREDMSESHMAQLNYSDRAISAMVVVKTKPLVNVTSCFHGGKEVLHQEVVSGHCGQSCQCLLGHIKCQSACESERHVVAASRTCPVPRLERKEQDCCPSWTCHPSANGCALNGLMMTSGQSVTEACQVCTCSNASVQCTSVCQPIGPAPRPGCELINITELCCPQWSCPLESRPPHGVRAAIIVQFHGTCASPLASFEEMVGNSLVSYVSSQPACHLKTDLCDSLSAMVICPGVSHEDFTHNRRRRSSSWGSDPNRVYVHISVYQNFSSDKTQEEIVQEVNAAGLRILPLLNASFDLLLENGQSLKSTNFVIYEGTTYVCDRSFTFVKDLDTCILNEIESVHTFKPNVRLTATSVLETSAGLQWTVLEPLDLSQVQGFIVEYRQDGTLQWLASHVLAPTLRYYNITSLKPDQNFTVRLMALMSWSGNSKWTVAELTFKTASTAGPLWGSYTMSMTYVSIQDSWALLVWDPLPSELMAQLSAVSVIYKQSHNSYYTNKESVPFKTQAHIQLTGLLPETLYTAEISMLFFSGETRSSALVHFVTKSSRNMSAELLVAVIISCVVSLIASVVVVLTCFMWRKSKKKGDTTGFENKTFGIPLENNNEESPICLPSVNSVRSNPTDANLDTVNLTLANDTTVNPASN